MPDHVDLQFVNLEWQVANNEAKCRGVASGDTGLQGSDEWGARSHRKQGDAVVRQVGGLQLHRGVPQQMFQKSRQIFAVRHEAVHGGKVVFGGDRGCVGQLRWVEAANELFAIEHFTAQASGILTHMRDREVNLCVIDLPPVAVPPITGGARG